MNRWRMDDDDDILVEINSDGEEVKTPLTSGG